MTRFVLGRAAAGIPVLLVAVTLAFALVHLLPGDPVDVMLQAGSTPAQREAVRHGLGLDAPLPTQYADYLGRLARGDLGRSIQTGRPVTDLLADAAPESLALAVVAFVLALALGGGVALLQVATRHPAPRAIASGLPALWIAAPGYWVGIVLMSVFAFGLGWFPATGDDGIRALVLPAVTLAIPVAAVFARVLGAGLRDAMRQPYILTARAKGAGRLRVLLRHALRNGAIPTVTVAGLAMGQLLAGAVLVETVFSRPGLGQTLVAAVRTQDLPVVQGLVVFLALVFIVVNLLVDLVYGVLDPRIAVAGRTGVR